jgi:hypothetical protein
MNMKKFSILVVAGVLTVVTALPVSGLAGQGSGKMKRNAGQIQTGTTSRGQDRLRLRDGSCISQTATASGKTQKNGNAYGPGDGTGNSGVGPQDGTGYGAPSKR